MNYWLMKSEPSEVSIDDLAAAPMGSGDVDVGALVQRLDQALGANGQLL